MNPASKTRTGGKDAPPSAGEGTGNKKTPNTDMQADDAGTSDSGNETGGTAAQKPMKQTSRTDVESGGRKR